MSFLLSVSQNLVVNPVQFIFFVLVILQGIMIFWDELYFHRRRELTLWEKVGHPMDTLCFVVAITALWFYGISWLSVSLALFSCLFVLKDEWVHIKHCGFGEQMLHGGLFMLHGGVLLSAHGMVWLDGILRSSDGVSPISLSFSTEVLLLGALMAAILVLFFQIFGNFRKVTLPVHPS